MAGIVVCEFLGEPYLQRLRSQHEVEYDPTLYADRPRLLSASADARAIIVRNRTRVDAQLVTNSPKLKVVGRLGVGLDNIDLDACAAAGVEVRPASGANAVSVAEFVIGAMLVLWRPVYGMTQAMAAGGWPSRGGPFGAELSGKTLGLLGFGSIARLVAARAAAFEMRIVAHDPFVAPGDEAWSRSESVSFEELLVQADVLSIHTRLNDLTRNLIDAHALERMKPTAILINTARGEIVDENALASALRAGTIGGAALDVFSQEPLPAKEASRFAHLENVLLTPHVAGSAGEAVHRVSSMTVDAVLEVLRG
jgi:(S)-sulfolactate dehydrogenase